MSDHQRASQLLPWLTNGRLNQEDAAWLSTHLSGCTQCRDELAVEHRVRNAIASLPTIEFAPQASFNRLWQRIEGEASVTPPLRPARTRFWSSWGRSGWLTAGIAAQLVVASILGVALWRVGAMQRADFRTVTESQPAPQAATIRVVFDDAMTLADVKEVLGRAGLTTRSGPTSAGVFTLAPDARHATFRIEDALESLRSDPRVRFAERGSD